MRSMGPLVKQDYLKKLLHIHTLYISFYLNILNSIKFYLLLSNMNDYLRISSSVYYNVYSDGKFGIHYIDQFDLNLWG